MTPAETLAKAKQLDRFLGKAVTETKASDRVAMNKFAELAAKIRTSREAMEAEADDLNVEVDKTMSIFMDAAGQNRSMLVEAREGAQAMREAALGMAGHNGAPLDDSPPAAPPSPPVIEPPVVELVPVAPPPVPAVDPTANGHAA